MGKHKLIITEKPEAARKIASALDQNGKPRKLMENGVPYYVLERNGEIIVAPALGHLYTVAGQGSRSNYPTFDFKWTPRYLVEKDAKYTYVWLKTISKLAKDADMFIDACDYDVEGSIIGYNILKYACDNKEQQAKRMKYSTLTKEELEKAYDKLLPNLDFKLIEAGRTRHEIDWLYGINLSRALTMAAKNYNKRYVTISTGRVQGPTLKFVAVREKSIQSFVPIPYWETKARVQMNGQVFEAQYEKEIVKTKREAKVIFEATKEKNGTIEKIDEKRFSQPPPAPFDLTTLQNEAYHLFRYTPKRTLNIAQNLYLDALISYPRTSSQKLPSAINYKEILKNLSNAQEYRKLANELLQKSELEPHEGNKEDPAHPAIYPTGKLPTTTHDRSAKNLWDLISRRFMATFADPAIKQAVRITIEINGYHFQLVGIQTLKKGWMHFYESYTRTKEQHLPPVKEGDSVIVEKIAIINKFTRPPPRYNPNSLLNKMTTAGIGTKATRADIVQTLYDRKYVANDNMNVTDLGLEVLTILEEFCSHIVSLEFTKRLEEKMNSIQLGYEKREETLKETIEVLKPTLEKLKESEKAIGTQLIQAIEEAQIEERTIGICPTCRTGKLIIIRSRKTGKRFVGCTNYFNKQCTTSFPLPQKGTVKPLHKTCSKCRWPIVQVRLKGKPIWVMCLNQQCPSKQREEE